MSGFGGNDSNPHSQHNRIDRDLANAEHVIVRLQATWRRSTRAGATRDEGAMRLELALFLIQKTRALLDERTLLQLFREANGQRPT